MEGKVVVGATVVVVVVVTEAADVTVSSVSAPLSREGMVVVAPPATPVGEVFEGATVVFGDPPAVVVVVADAPDEGVFVVVVACAIVVVVDATVVVVAAAGIDTATDAGDPEEMLVWFADPEYDTENDEASASELVPVAPSAEMVDTAEIVQTVDDVWAIVIDTMLVRSKSTPSVAETVEQSI